MTPYVEQETNMSTVIRMILVIAFIGTLAACGGGDTYVKVQGTTNISKGQELSDLQRALQDGAINKTEYDRLYNKIINRPN